MPPRTLAVAGALLTALAVPAGAQAAPPTLSPLKPCYVTVGQGAAEREAVAVNATGFTPNSTVDLAVDGQPVPGGTVQVDANGAIGAQSPLSVAAPYIQSGSRDFSLSLTETGNPANTVMATAKTTALGIEVKPNKANPSRIIRFRGNGFTGTKSVYAHYVFKGKLKRTVKMAVPAAPCGFWTAYKRQIPIANPRTGRWTVQFDQLKRYVAPPSIPSVYVRLTISVTRVVHRN